MRPYFESLGVTIYHGDALLVLPALHEQGVTINALVTDAPYSSGGQFRGDRTARTREKYQRSEAKHETSNFSGDSRDQRSFLAWASQWLAASRLMASPGALGVVFSDWRQLPTMTDAFQSGGWVWRGVGVWSKKFGRPRSGAFSSACEFTVWGTNGDLEASELYAPGIVEASSPPFADRLHLTEKPLPVMRWALTPIQANSVILDPFLGSGTTIAAGLERGLKVIGVEIDEANCEKSARRVERYATRGRISDELASIREQIGGPRG